MPSSVDLREDSGRELEVTDRRIKLGLRTAQFRLLKDKLPSGRFSSVQDRRPVASTDRRPRLSPAQHRPAVPHSEGRVLYASIELPITVFRDIFLPIEAVIFPNATYTTCVVTV